MLPYSLSHPFVPRGLCIQCNTQPRLCGALQSLSPTAYAGSQHSTLLQGICSASHEVQLLRGACAIGLVSTAQE